MCQSRSWAWTKPWAKKASWTDPARAWGMPSWSRQTSTGPVETTEPMGAREIGKRGREVAPAGGAGRPAGQDRRSPSPTVTGAPRAVKAGVSEARGRAHGADGCRPSTARRAARIRGLSEPGPGRYPRRMRTSDPGVRGRGRPSSSCPRSARTTARARARSTWSVWTPARSGGCAAPRGTPTRPASSARRWGATPSAFTTPTACSTRSGAWGRRARASSRASPGRKRSTASRRRSSRRRPATASRPSGRTSTRARWGWSSGTASTACATSWATPAGTRRSASPCRTRAGSPGSAPSAAWTSARWASTRSSS